MLLAVPAGVPTEGPVAPVTLNPSVKIFGEISIIGEFAANLTLLNFKGQNGKYL